MDSEAVRQRAGTGLHVVTERTNTNPFPFPPAPAAAAPRPPPTPQGATASAQVEAYFSVAQRLAREEGRQRDDQSHLYGAGLLALIVIFFVVSMYTMVVSKIMPETGNPILDFWRDDWYYCLLLPGLFPAMWLIFYLNWVSMKFFRHN